jgi:GT2 family glycosyltransferase
MRDVTLCIINYNGAQHLPRAFAALRAQAWDFTEVLVVDNASTDGGVDQVASLWPHARVIRLERNGGPGAARNAGFAAASSDIILFQDNDVQLEAVTAARLVDDLLAHPDTLAVAPRVLYADDPCRVQFDSADCHFLGLMATRNADSAVRDVDDAACDTTSLVTACFLIDRAQWRGSNPFDETLGFNLEDHDFAVRASLAGHRLRVEPRARVLHGSGTTGLSWRPGALPAEERQFYLTRNRWIVIAKCYHIRTLLVLAPALVLFELLQFSWLLLQRRPHIWWRAASSLWRRRKDLTNARRAVQQTRRTADAQVLRDTPLPTTRYVTTKRTAAGVVRVADALFRAYWRWTRRWVG